MWSEQSFRQPSTGNESFLMQPSRMLPSSQVSASCGCVTLSPQNVQSWRQTVNGFDVGEPGGSHVSPLPMMLSPQTAGMQLWVRTALSLLDLRARRVLAHEAAAGVVAGVDRAGVVVSAQSRGSLVHL